MTTALCRPENPCGDDLEDTQLLASFDAFRLFGQAVPLDPETKWPLIKAQSMEAIQKKQGFAPVRAFCGCVVARGRMARLSWLLARRSSNWIKNLLVCRLPACGRGRDLAQERAQRLGWTGCRFSTVSAACPSWRIGNWGASAYGTWSWRRAKGAERYRYRAGQRGRRWLRYSPQPVPWSCRPSRRGDRKPRSMTSNRSIRRCGTLAGVSASPDFDPLLSMLVKIDTLVGEQPSRSGASWTSAEDADGAGISRRVKR